MDWRRTAEASGLTLDAAELDRIVPVLQAIESAFHPFAQQIPHDVEPAIVLSDAAVAGG